MLFIQLISAEQPVIQLAIYLGSVNLDFEYSPRNSAQILLIQLFTLAYHTFWITPFLTFIAHTIYFMV